MRPCLFLRAPDALPCGHKMLFATSLPLHMWGLLLPPAFSENSYTSSKTQLLSLLWGASSQDSCLCAPSRCSTGLELNLIVFG